MRATYFKRRVTALVFLTACFMGNAAGQEQQQAIPTGRPDPDFVEPAGLDDHVKSSDVVVIARPVRRLEPRVQTNTLEVRGKPVTSTRVFARYLVHVDRLIKAPRNLKFDGDQVIEQAVGDASLAAFKGGLPDLGPNDLMLFLKYYPPGQTFQIGSWNSQFKKTAEGAVQAVQTQPPARFVRDHPILGAAVTNRSPSDWSTFVREVEALAPKNRGR